jgi:Tfp pilus assembly protein PilF
MTARGLPRVDGLVSQALKRARSAAPALTRVEPVGLQAGFARIAVRSGAEDEARAFAHQQLRLLKDDPRTLNNFAWMLLTEEPFAGEYDDLAATFAEASVAASGGSVWQYLDTLALARFRAGLLQEAVRLQERALELVGAGEDRAALEDSLARFRKAAGDGAASGEKPPH